MNVGSVWLIFALPSKVSWSKHKIRQRFKWGWPSFWSNIGHDIINIMARTRSCLLPGRSIVTPCKVEQVHRT